MEDAIKIKSGAKVRIWQKVKEADKERLQTGVVRMSGQDHSLPVIATAQWLL